MMHIMRKATGIRAENKRESLDKILDAAARRMREEGLDGAAIVPVTRDAGLTHGAFFRTSPARTISPPPRSGTRSPLAACSGSNRRDASRGERDWPASPNGISPPHIATTFPPVVDSPLLAPTPPTHHPRSAPVTSTNCEVAGRDLRRGRGPHRLDDAIALMTICVGGMSLARAVVDPKLSARILRVARDAAAKLPTPNRIKENAMVGAKPYGQLQHREINGKRMAFVDEGQGDAIVFQHGNPTLVLPVAQRDAAPRRGSAAWSPAT